MASIKVSILIERGKDSELVPLDVPNETTKYFTFQPKADTKLKNGMIIPAFTKVYATKGSEPKIPEKYAGLTKAEIAILEAAKKAAKGGK